MRRGIHHLKKGRETKANGDYTCELGGDALPVEHCLWHSQSLIFLPGQGVRVGLPGPYAGKNSQK